MRSVYASEPTTTGSLIPTLQSFEAGVTRTAPRPSRKHLSPNGRGTRTPLCSGGWHHAHLSRHFGPARSHAGIL